jgi:hypothetical protein
MSRPVLEERVVTDTLRKQMARQADRDRGHYLPDIPFSVVRRAWEATCGGPTLLQAIALQLLCGQQNGQITLSPHLCEALGYKQAALRHALTRLEEAELIRWESAPGKRRTITLLDEEYLAWLGNRRRPHNQRAAGSAASKTAFPSTKH